MSNGLKQSTSKLKTYHIFFISCLLTTFMVLNSNRVNEARTLKKENEKADTLFSKIISLRNLDASTGTVNHQNSEGVCALGSDDLNDYYKTGDLSKIDLDDDGIKSEDKDKSYMKALRTIVKNLVDGGGEEEDDNINGGRILRRLQEIDQNDLMEYGKRILPMLVFLVFGVLGIFGWIICCFCCCCNCCCCCCCKKEGCKIPCFIFTYVFYALVVAVCIYGLTQSNKIFEGIANTECSILKLLEQVLDGEIKQTTPRWIGISGINGLLDGLKDQIESLKGTAWDNFQDKKLNITQKKENFLTGKSNFETFCYDGISYLSGYSREFEDISSDNIYYGKTFVLDIISLVGHKGADNNYPNTSFLYSLNYEYSEVSERTDGYISTSETSFDDILNRNTDEVKRALNKAKDTLNKLKKPFDKINNKIGDKISDYSKQIDDKGKLGVKLVFGVLMIMNIALGVLVIFIGLCSMKSCKDCCFCRCLFKFCTHLLWNILALMMILAFFVGSILSLVGRLGGDAMELVSYTLSEENLDNDRDPFLIGQAEDVKNYLKICLHGNGSLESEFDLGDSLQHIEDIDDVLNGLDNVTQQFNQIKSELPSFRIFNQWIDQRTDYQTDEFGLLDTSAPDDLSKGISLKIALQLLNTAINNEDDNRENWGLDGDEGKTCTSESDPLTVGKYKLHPDKCMPDYRTWIKSSTNLDIKDSAKIVSTIVQFVNELKKTSSESFKANFDSLNQKYNEYLDSYIEMINFLKETISQLIGEIKAIAGDGRIFSFVNGKFIGINIKIILKYLKYSLGQDLYTVGLCLDIVGLSLILSISSTILLIAIINTLLKNMQQQTPPDGVIPYQNNAPRQISVQNY